MKRLLDEYWVTMAIILGGIAALSYGLSDIVPFLKGICILIPSVAAVFYFFVFKHENKEDTALRDEMGNIIMTQDEVILEYETIFDSQMVELPCICGGNTYEGLFSPKLDNIVECENCKNKFRITIDYNTTLISEPLDINLNQKFDNLVKSVD